MGARELPTGIITLLFSDIEGSTRLLQELGSGYESLLQAHNQIMRQVASEHDGDEVSTAGDSFFVVFSDPGQAVRAAAVIQRSLADYPFPRPVRVRMRLHTGQGRLSAGHYVGIDVHRAARIASAAHGGQVVLSDATRALVEPELSAVVSLRDLGSHRLKDLARPEHLYQLVIAGLPFEFAPLRSLDAQPNNLPAQLTPLVGRQHEVGEIKRRLLDSVRLITLTGPGGTGKTRLALEVAAETLPTFPDGTWFIDLAAVTGADLVVSAIAETLGIRDEPGGGLQEALARKLQGQSALLLLDNFEQVLPAGASVEQLLQDAPHVKVLVTSRTALHRRGEYEFPVLPLAVPPSGSLVGPSSLVEFDAVRLFVERAVAVRPDFTLKADNAAAVAAITIRLDGLPLAIELAASRVKILSPQAICDWLEHGFELLVSRVPDAPARQRTLRQAIEWSYDLLQPAERVLFAQLAVFLGGASLEAIEAVCSPEHGVDVLELLESLVDNSLVRQADGDEGEPRFVMLEAIREYAAERLEEQPQLSGSTRRAHATHFADFAHAQWDRLAHVAREDAVRALRADIENLRLAWRYWVGEGDLARLNSLLDCLWLIYDARGWYLATVELANDLLGVLTGTPMTRDRAVQELTLRTSLAEFLMAVHGYTQEVEDAYRSALDLLTEHRDMPQLLPVLRGLASFYTYRAEFDKGAELGHEILRLAETQGDRSMRVDGHLVLGSSLAFQGDLRIGLEHPETAIAEFDATGTRTERFRLGNNPGVASFTTSALVLWLLGYPDKAVLRADRAIATASESGQPFTLAFALFHAAFLHLWRREPDVALARAANVRKVAAEHGLSIWTAVGTCVFGAANVGMGHFEEGLTQIEEGLGHYQGLNTPPVFWPLLLTVRAGAYGHAGRSEKGLRLIEEALAIVGSGPLLPELYLVKGDLLLGSAEAEVGIANRWFQLAFEAAAGLDAKMPQLRAAARLHRMAGDGPGASEGQRMLRAVYDRFDEGFATADLQEARELLQTHT